MKPKPLASLNHFTVPCSTLYILDFVVRMNRRSVRQVMRQAVKRGQYVLKTDVVSIATGTIHELVQITYIPLILGASVGSGLPEARSPLSLCRRFATCDPTRASSSWYRGSPWN